MKNFKYILLTVTCTVYFIKFSSGYSFPWRWIKDSQNQPPSADANTGDHKYDSTQTMAEDPICHDTTIIDYALRLKGCSDQVVSQAGRLEIYYKGDWHSVCDDDFDKLDAQVACYSLGFRQNEGLMIGQYFKEGSDKVEIVLDDLRCNGTESVLDQCTHAAWVNHNCGRVEAVSIACVADSLDHFKQFGYRTRLVNDNENTTNAGRLEIFHRGEWGTVCDDDFDNNAQGHLNAEIACRALNQNFTTGIFVRNEFGAGTGRIWLDSVICTPEDHNIGNCAHDPWGVHDCNHEEDVSIICGQCFDETCLNNSTCLDVDTPYCLCRPGYSGVRCEIEGNNCAEAPCLNGGECEYWFGSFRCRCAAGFTGEWCETSTGAATTTTTTSTTTRTTPTPAWTEIDPTAWDDSA